MLIAYVASVASHYIIVPLRKICVTMRSRNTYEGRSMSSGTVLLIKHRANAEYLNYSEVVPQLTQYSLGAFA